MLCGQVAMIISPLAMSQLSLINKQLPWFVSSVTGIIVIICMVMIRRTNYGISTGLVSAEDAKISTPNGSLI